MLIVDLAKRLIPGGLDFVVLPGDNADDGTPEQFAIVRDAIGQLPLPMHILPGDHDFKPRSLDAFHQVLGADRLPKSIIVSDYRCLFLDVVSSGTGGPDFRLDTDQLAWTEREIAKAEESGETVAIFMHTYPADLHEGASGLNALLSKPNVVCVDMGHTHYNELANDGRTIFMTTRSTGQIEEGAAGFSVAAIDHGVVSWRFHPVDAGWPLVLITNPADHRLIINPFSPNQLVRTSLRVAAKIFSDRPIVSVSASIDGAPPFRLALEAASAALWNAVSHDELADGMHDLTVNATDEAGRATTETIRFLVDRAGHYKTPDRFADGSDRDALAAWPDKHLLGTQLGPNRNGRKW